MGEELFLTYTESKKKKNFPISTFSNPIFDKIYN